MHKLRKRCGTEIPIWNASNSNITRNYTGSAERRIWLGVPKGKLNQKQRYCFLLLNWIAKNVGMGFERTRSPVFLYTEGREESKTAQCATLDIVYEVRRSAERESWQLATGWKPPAVQVVRRV